MHELMSSDSSTKKHRPGPGHHARPHAHPGHARGRRRPCRRRGDRHAGRARWRSGGAPRAPNNGAGGVLMDVSYFVVLGFEFFAD